VLPLFLEQMARGGPLTVTDRDACRYFITVDRAVEALFAVLGSRSDARILIADAGPAVRILDLAEHLVRAHGSASAIEFTGLRPGDKLSERLLSSRERWVGDGLAAAQGVRAIESPSLGAGAIHDAMLEMKDAVCARDLERLLRGVLELVPEYRPSEVIEASLASSEAAAVMQA
jgi:FlaA1/EpsC-like NDP-sugar epimerase